CRTIFVRYCLDAVFHLYRHRSGEKVTLFSKKFAKKAFLLFGEKSLLHNALRITY
ncbi:hypothetical protein RUMCAL_01977, partial [Ruminococcus callidus ATCC 27760]